jgi:hypothetical protein
MADLSLPVLDLILPLKLLLTDELIENVPDAVHLLFATQVESDISCVSTGSNQRDHRRSGGIKPTLVCDEKLIEKMGVLATRREVLAKGGDIEGELALGLLKGLQEGFVRRVLKSPQAALFIDRHREDVSGCCDIMIGVLEIADSLLRVANLPYEGSGDEQERYHRKQQSLQQYSI